MVSDGGQHIDVAIVVESVNAAHPTTKNYADLGAQGQRRQGGKTLEISRLASLAIASISIPKSCRMR